MSMDKEPSKVIENLNIFHPEGLTLPQEVLSSIAIKKTSESTQDTVPEQDNGTESAEIRAKVEELRQKIEITRETIARKKSA